MMFAFEITSMIVTSCRTHSVQFSSNAAFEWGGAGLNTILGFGKCTLNLGARGWGKRGTKLSHPFRNVAGPLIDPHRAISIDDAQTIHGSQRSEESG